MVWAEKNNTIKKFKKSIESYCFMFLFRQLIFV